MLRNTIIALLTVAVVGAVSPTTASAREGHGGGGFHHYGGFHGGGFGIYAPYGPYGYIPYYGDAGVCYEEHQRVKTRYGWGIRRVSICE